MSMKNRLRLAWQQRGWLARLLWPLSWVYAALMRQRHQAYGSGQKPVTRLPVPVVVVGNVVAGGAGKTPLVLALVRHCQQTGWQVGVVSRGYGRRLDDVRAVHVQSTADEVGDEPLLIARSTQAPVWVGRDRVAAAQAMLAQHPQLNLIISDDGLQHWALARDLELCVFDERDIGNGWLLPAGPLREPWPRSLSMGAPCIEVQSEPAQAGRIAVHRRLADQAHRADGTQRALWHWQGQSVRALAGIAKPEQFFAALQSQGLHLRQCMALPDHDDMQNLQLNANAGEDVLCTEKDAVKLWPRYPHVWAVPLVIDLPRALTDAIDALVIADAKAKAKARTTQSHRYHLPHGQQTS